MFVEGFNVFGVQVQYWMLIAALIIAVAVAFGMRRWRSRWGQSGAVDAGPSKLGHSWSAPLYGGLFLGLQLLGLQHVRLTAIGLRHIQKALGDFEIWDGLSHALSLVGLFPEEFGFFHHRTALKRSRWPRLPLAGVYDGANLESALWKAGSASGTILPSDSRGTNPRISI
jgi:hypothetical protein